MGGHETGWHHPVAPNCSTRMTSVPTPTSARSRVRYDARSHAAGRQDAWLALPDAADASYQRSTRNALKVFHRLGVPSGSSNRKWTAPECLSSSSTSSNAATTPQPPAPGRSSS